LVPLAPETLAHLEQLSRLVSEKGGATVSPLQVAALLLEHATQSADGGMVILRGLALSHAHANAAASTARVDESTVKARAIVARDMFLSGIISAAYWSFPSVARAALINGPWR
jgi:hypothetical protein